MRQTAVTLKRFVKYFSFAEKKANTTMSALVCVAGSFVFMTTKTRGENDW